MPIVSPVGEPAGWPFCRCGIGVGAKEILQPTVEDAETSGCRSASLFVCKVHQLGNLFGRSAIVIDRAFFDSVRADHRKSCPITTTAAVNLYRVYLYFARYTPSRDQLFTALGNRLQPARHHVASFDLTRERYERSRYRSIVASALLLGGVNHKPKLHRGEVPNC
jgi:hypothetical protein